MIERPYLVKDCSFVAEYFGLCKPLLEFWGEYVQGNGHVWGGHDSDLELEMWLGDWLKHVAPGVYTPWLSQSAVALRAFDDVQSRRRMP